MGTVTTSLIDRAEGIFSDLGYSVSAEGSELRAQRKWRTVRVTPMAEPGPLPDSGEFRCFVTFATEVDAVERELEASDPDYEWAIIGLEDADRYEVVRGSRASGERAP